MSLDFNNIITGLNRIDSAKKNQENSFISNIPRGQDASYLVTNNALTNVSHNMSYANASFLGHRNDLSAISAVKQTTPFFADLKSKNAGESKITVPAFNVNYDERMLAGLTPETDRERSYLSQPEVPKEMATRRDSFQPLPQHRLTLGQDCIAEPGSAALRKQHPDEQEQLQQQLELRELEL